MEENPIRRERMRKLERKKITEEMRAALPVYRLEEIRNRKLAYHEALLSGLADKGYLHTCSYLEFLFKFQSENRNRAGPISIIWSRPQLYQSTNELKLLSERLSQAEECHKAGKYTQECQKILEAAVYFAFSNEFWWWLGEHLFISTLIICEQYTFLDKFYEALTRYCYGKFLMENFKKDSAAMEHLSMARKLSTGKEWTTRILFPLDSDVLYLKVNYLLYLCFIRQVENLMETDYIEAGKIAVLARRRATEACFLEGQIRANMLRGMCQLSYNDTKGAIESFSKAFYIQSQLGSEKGLCEARIHIARAYLLDGNRELSLRILLLLRECAEENNLPYYLAQSYRHLGEFFLNHQEATKATLLLRESLNIFEKYNFVKESEQVRNLEAISIGLESFSKYTQLLLKSDEKNPMCELIEWKDSRKPFFEYEVKDPSYSIEDIILESLTEVEGRRGGDPDIPEYPDELSVTSNDKEDKLND